MSAPIVSVVMPVYNAERYLASAVQSILEQRFKDFEFIIVDDGSTDASGSMLRDIARLDGRIRLIRRENTGIVGALNDGLAASRGEFVARMDADDVALPQRFARQVDYLRKHAECVAVGSEVLLIDPDGEPICRKPTVMRDHERIDAALLTGGWPVVHPAVMMRLEAVRRVGGYKPETFPQEDHDLFLRLAEIGRLANLPDILLEYRQHFQSICFTDCKRQEQVRKHIIERTCRRRGIPIPSQPVWENISRRKQTKRQRLMWAWWALSAGHVATARKHAWRYLRQSPFSLDSWRVMACAMRGY